MIASDFASKPDEIVLVLKRLKLTLSGPQSTGLKNNCRVYLDLYNDAQIAASIHSISTPSYRHFDNVSMISNEMIAARPWVMTLVALAVRFCVKYPTTPPDRVDAKHS